MPKANTYIGQCSSYAFVSHCPGGDQQRDQTWQSAQSRPGDEISRRQRPVVDYRRWGRVSQGVKGQRRDGPANNEVSGQHDWGIDGDPASEPQRDFGGMSLQEGFMSSRKTPATAARKRLLI